MDRTQTAKELFAKGYNCSQSVACAYADICGVSEETMFRISEAFGGGMGGLQQTCGAVTGAYMVISMLHSGGDTSAPRATKADTYAAIRSFTEAFEQKNSTTLCSELRGTPETPKRRSCIGCVEDAVALLEEMVNA